ncbi:hypothetical protein MHU86_14779 [Fragilaria crotonensis]|nr:hypothetical protein MHU86_14779 [Fragilaria crotonensis]
MNPLARETLNFYPDADPDPLPELPNDPDPAPTDIVDDDFDDGDETNRDIGEPNEVPSATIQQPVRMLPPLFPAPPFRHANPLNKIHHHPFRMFQDMRHEPAPGLFFPEGMHDDMVNGIIQLRDLPLCVRMSATLAALFCINVLSDQPELGDIRGHNLPHGKSLSNHVTKYHIYLDQTRHDSTPQLQHQPIFKLRSMVHTLNRATNLVIHHLNDQQRSQFQPRNQHLSTFPAFSMAFLDDYVHTTHPMETRRCAVAIANLRTPTILPQPLSQQLQQQHRIRRAPPLPSTSLCRRQRAQVHRCRPKSLPRHHNLQHSTQFYCQECFVMHLLFMRYKLFSPKFIPLF